MLETENKLLSRYNFNELTLAEIVGIDYKAAAIFEKYNLDFCCKGKRLLKDACAEKGIDVEAVLTELKSFAKTSNGNTFRYDSWSADFLIEFIIKEHHSYVRNMIPLLLSHTKKIAEVHGANHPELISIAKTFGQISKELSYHMRKEEEILFPYIMELSRSKQTGAKIDKPYFGSVNNPIKLMLVEHDSAGDALYTIRELTGNYTPPADGCETYKITFQELKAFEVDLHKHVHLENNVLFPKAVELEKEIFAGTASVN